MGVRRGDPLSETTIHHILQNERRHQVLKYLFERESTVSLRDLSEWIAEAEADGTPPSEIRDSVYVSLHQNHLPRLDEAGVIEYDKDRKLISLQPEAQSVEVYMRVFTRFGITWSTYYMSLAIVSLLVIVGADLGVPGLALVDPLIWAILGLLVIGVSGAYQYWMCFRPFLR